MDADKYDQERSAAALSVVIVVRQRTAHVLVAGELDISTSDMVVSAAEAVLREQTVATIKVDVALVDFCESSGIQALLRARHLAAARGIGLYLVGVRPSLRRLLMLEHTAELLEHAAGDAYAEGHTSGGCWARFRNLFVQPPSR